MSHTGRSHQKSRGPIHALSIKKPSFRRVTLVNQKQPAGLDRSLALKEKANKNRRLKNQNMKCQGNYHFIESGPPRKDKSMSSGSRITEIISRIKHEDNLLKMFYFFGKKLVRFRIKKG